jgi:ATP-binding cassette subfamily B protein
LAPAARSSSARSARAGPPQIPAGLRARAGLVLRMIPKAVGLVWEATPGYASANVALTVVQGILPAVAIWFTKAIVDGVIVAAKTQSRAATAHVLELVAFWFGVQLFLSLLSTLQQFISSLQTDLLGNHVSVRLMEKASTLDLAYFENAQFYDKLENARNQASYRPGQLVFQLFGLLRSAVTLLSVIGVLGALSWWLVVLVVVISIPSLIYQAKYGGQMFLLQTSRAADQRRLHYLSYLLTTDTPVKELRIFGLHATLVDRYRQIFDRFFRENRSFNLRRSSSQFALGALGTVMSGLTYAYVVLETIAERLTLGQLTLYYQAYQQSQSQLTNLLSGIASAYENSLFLTSLFEFFSYVPELKVRSNPVRTPQPIVEGVRLEHVSFQYPGTDKWVLKDVSFVIRPGEPVALVGANGAGKTTLVKLLGRLYDPVEGRITVDGIDLRDLDPVEWRARVGVIFQDYVHYQLTLGDNIGFGRVEAAQDRERIAAAAAQAGADTVAAGLPLGYETPLGRWFHEGEELSVGQWQKVALARAFMRKADLLILDEPTASLDVQSEYEVFRAFAELTKGNMAVLISHRFSTVRMARHIVVIQDGAVTESGSHDELVTRGGHYAELFEMQAASYR